MKREILSIENGIIKREENIVFSNLYLRLFEGEITGIIFDNILERQLFIELLKGQAALKAGKIYWKEKRVSLLRLEKKLEKEVAVIERNSKLIHSITVAENIFLFEERTIFTRQKAYKERFEKLKGRYGALQDAPRRVEYLTAKEKVIAEILKAYVEGKKIVILDDLSSFLQSSEVDDICKLIQRLPEDMTFIIIIGFEDTGVPWMDSITVVQNGRTVAVMDPDRKQLQKTFHALLDRPKVTEPFSGPLSVMPEEGGPILEFQEVETDYLQGVNLKVESGEILKVCYLDERSKTEFIQLLQGDLAPDRGRLLLDTMGYRPKDIHDAIRKGVCFVEEVPYRSMLLQNMTLAENLCIPLHDKVPLFWMRSRYEKSVETFTEDLLGIKDGKRKLKNLKETTLQQIAYTKWLLYAPKVVVCINPFMELDIKMREITLEMLEMYKKMGIAVIVLTSNLYTVNNIEGEVLYLYGGMSIDEEEAYHRIYKKS